MCAEKSGRLPEFDSLEAESIGRGSRKKSTFFFSGPATKRGGGLRALSLRKKTVFFKL